MNVRDDDRFLGNLGLGHCRVMPLGNRSNKKGVKTLQRELWSPIFPPFLFVFFSLSPSFFASTMLSAFLLCGHAAILLVSCGGTLRKKPHRTEVEYAIHPLCNLLTHPRQCRNIRVGQSKNMKKPWKSRVTESINGFRDRPVRLLRQPSPLPHFGWRTIVEAILVGKLMRT